MYRQRRSCTVEKKCIFFFKTNKIIDLDFFYKKIIHQNFQKIRRHATLTIVTSPHILRMHVILRNSILLILVIYIHSQIWMAEQGWPLYQSLKEKVSWATQDAKKLEKKLQESEKNLDEDQRKELIEEHAREVYHFVPSKEKFFKY